MKGRHQRQEMVTQNHITSIMTRPQKLFNFRETETSTLKLNEMRYEEKLYYFESQSFHILLIQFSNGIPHQKTFNLLSDQSSGDVIKSLKQQFGWTYSSAYMSH